MADRNQVSFNQRADGAITRNGIVIFEPGTPRAERVWHEGDIFPSDSGIADSLKVSGVTGLTIHVGTLRGGVEDCFDVNNRCSDIELHIARAEPKGRYVGTIKGESDNIRVNVEVQAGHGREADYDYGNRSQQAKGRTKNCTLRVGAADGPVSVRVLHAWRPALTAGPGVRFDVDDRARGWIAALFDLFPLIFGKGKKP